TDEQHRLRVRVPSEPRADHGHLLLLFGEHHIGAVHRAPRLVDIMLPEMFTNITRPSGIQAPREPRPSEKGANPPTFRGARRWRAPTSPGQRTPVRRRSAHRWRCG